MYKDGCKGCDLSKGHEKPLGGVIVELEGEWLLNHYGGQEGYLGWLALQPREHRIELHELTTEEANALGGNIKRIDKALRDYWEVHFPSDRIERVYIVYFFESVFDDPPTRWHLHIHLITRTERVGKGNPSRMAAWYTPCLVKWNGFPQEYRVRDESTKERINKERVEDLMKFLKMRLEKQSTTIE
jgi:diadenosine tetraphosphate (Ap4A) HIT family hydrolase